MTQELKPVKSTIPMFTTHTKADLVALDLGGFLKPIDTFEAAGKTYEIRFVGDGKIFGYVTDKSGKRAFYRALESTRVYNYFTYDGHRHIVLKRLEELCHVNQNNQN